MLRVLIVVALTSHGCGTEPASSLADGSSSGVEPGGSTTTASVSTTAASDPTAEATTDTTDTTDTISPSGTEASGSGESSGETTGDPAAGCPPAPAELTHWLVGADADADVSPLGPALILMGGGPDVDAAFTWWQAWVSGGDAIVLRTSGEDGYNDYLFSTIGGVDSVETMLVDTAALADDPYVVCRIAHAEAVFMAGGDQGQYMSLWKDRGLADAVMMAWSRGAVVGGTSAGLAVLGEFVFAAYQDTVYSDEALEDPYNRYMTMDRGLFEFPPLLGVVTDSHFYERDRMGRLVGFIARIIQDGWALEVLGLGVDEGTALLVDPDGLGTVVGVGAVYAVRSSGPPQLCEPGEPLAYADLERMRLVAGDTIALPTGTTTVESETISAADGALQPSDPY